MRRSLAPARIGQRDFGLGARAAIEQHGGGLTLYGGDLWLALWPDELFGLELAAGLRNGVDEPAEHGAVASRALCAAADVLVAIVPRSEDFSLHAALGVALASLRVQGVDVSAGGAGEQGAGIDVHARLGFGLALAPWPAFALRADVSGGVPLRSVAALDAGEDVASTAGVQLRSALGAEVRF